MKKDSILILDIKFIFYFIIPNLKDADVPQI